jgi:hypothetical protein
VQKGQKSDKESGKLVENGNRDSAFSLNAPVKAVGTLRDAATVKVQLQHSTPTISVEIERMSRRLIIDTCSTVSILEPGVSRGDVEITHSEPCRVTGDILDIKGQGSVSFALDGCEYQHTFLVCALPTKTAGLIGKDFL